MPHNTENKNQIHNFEFQTPIKPKLKLLNQPTTAPQTYDSRHQNSFHNSNSTMNMFKRKRYHKRIKKFTLQLLQMQSQALQSYKNSLSESYSESVNQLYKQELDKIFVIVARITHIDNDKRYFIFHCQDEGQNDFKLYFNKHASKEFQTRLFSYSEKKYESRYITNLDALQFQSIPGQGIPYFKFFVILREFPIFDKSQQIVLNSEENVDSQSNELVENSARKNFLSHIIGTQFRAYIEHFEKVRDFNYLTWHNMHVCFEDVCQQLLSSQNKQDIEI